MTGPVSKSIEKETKIGPINECGSYCRCADPNRVVQSQYAIGLSCDRLPLGMHLKFALT